MQDTDQDSIMIFVDTLRRCSEDPELKEAVTEMCAGTRLYGADDYPTLSREKSRAGRITVTQHRTFEAAMLLKREAPDKKTAVLNFASAVNPGGGVKYGAMAQEECLCRCSTLYLSLDTPQMWDNYYSVNRAMNDVRHTDACIYSPDVVVFKTDERAPQPMERKDRFTVDVITCAAPNLRDVPAVYDTETGGYVRMGPDKLYELHLKRARHIFHIAAANGVDMIVPGAFGCGAFRNDPNIVAKAYKAALEEYAKYFDIVEFAVFCGRSDTGNYDTFKKILG